ncbi:MAG: FAD-binding protein, partial [Pseudomonadales bacterium]
MNEEQNSQANGRFEAAPASAPGAREINDVTGLNPIRVWGVATPTSTEELQAIVRRSSGPLSVGGGHFSMGGQTASPGSLHIDMRQLNQVVQLDPVNKQIRVQSGVRWCDIQRFIDPHDLAVQIMQTYANFTVGGSLSVNVHGRYIGLGPLILSVREITLVLADGSLVIASPTQRADLFFGAIGGYGGLGVIVDALLDLADNVRVERVAKKLPADDYLSHFRSVQNDPRSVIFHNADLYPPHYAKLRSVSWYESERPATNNARLQRSGRRHWLEKYFYWSFTESPFGGWRREHLVDPLLYARRKVHWRNYEAGYDVAELEPVSRERRTYVLQEYFVPVARFGEFVTQMAEILNRHRVNVINVSVRHALPDSGSLLSWAPEESFAFVLYYKQRTRDNARSRVAVWTRELIDAALSVAGRYYLPYQPHGTSEQFHSAYPRAKELFALKASLDPRFRWRNALWDKYYGAEESDSKPQQATVGSEFHQIFSHIGWSDDFYRFLQVVFRLHPEDRMHQLIQDACSRHPIGNGDTGTKVRPDEAIYRDLQQKLPTIRPWHGALTYALPALATQKRVMTSQTLTLLGSRKHINGYLEIGSTGRYASALNKEVKLSGDLVFVHDQPPSYSPVDIAERGGIKTLGRYLPLNDYEPLNDSIADASLDFVSCLIGLHHIPPDSLDAFISSIARVLRTGGMFVLRDHDVDSPAMDAFVALVHTVFNCGTDVPWAENASELRYFAPVSTWVERLGVHGLID